MGPLHPSIEGHLQSLRVAEMRREACLARLASSVSKRGGTGVKTARALRSLADRLDPGMECEARVA